LLPIEVSSLLWVSVVVDSASCTITGRPRGVQPILEGWTKQSKETEAALPNPHWNLCLACRGNAEIIR